MSSIRNSGINLGASESTHGNARPSFDGFRQSVRHASLVRIRQHCDSNDIELAEIKGDLPQVYANWMGLILVAGPSLRLIFKAHFDSRDVKAMGKSAFSVQGEENPSFHTIADFVREYSNLVGGVIKGIFEGAGLSVGVSLPLVTRGFDEIFSERRSTDLSFSDAWMQVSGSSKLVCTLELEFMNAQSMKAFAEATKEVPVVQEQGDVDFL